MITEIDAGHIIYDDLSFLGLERRLKGHLLKGLVDGNEPVAEECVPQEGIVVILPKTRTANATYFNTGTIEVNILVPDIAGETSPSINGLLRKVLDAFSGGKVGEYDGTWYRYSVRSHGIEEESRLKCHYANITIDFETLNVRS